MKFTMSELYERYFGSEKVAEQYALLNAQGEFRRALVDYVQKSECNYPDGTTIEDCGWELNAAIDALTAYVYYHERRARDLR